VQQEEPDREDGSHDERRDESDPALGVEVQPLEEADGQLVPQRTSKEDDGHPVVEVREDREQQSQQEPHDPAGDRGRLTEERRHALRAQEVPTKKPQIGRRSGRP
jgi:hypothetical protein